MIILLLKLILGSTMFHMTLLYPMQLLDELPMIYSFSFNLYALIDVLMIGCKLEEDRKIEKTLVFKFFESRQYVFLLLLVYCSFVSFVYIFVFTDPVFHQTSFGLLIVLNIIFAYENSKIYNIPKKLFVLAIVYFLIGFLFWNLDNHFCNALRSHRLQVETFFRLNNSNTNELDINGVILNILAVSLKSISEFHSYWHVFTAYSSFVGILFLIEIDYERHLKENRIRSRERPVKSKCYGIVCYIMTESECINSKSKIN